MRKALLLGLFVLLIFVPFVSAEEPERTVSFQGEGLVTAVPDQLVLSLLVSEKNTSMRKAIERQAEKMNALLGLLKTHGVPDKNIRTSNFNYQPVYEYDNGKQRQIRTGYSASQSLIVKMDAKNGPNVLDAIGDGQLADLNGVSFRVSNADDLREKATKMAIEDAKSIATRRAAQVGLVLGPVIGYSESGPGRQEAQDAPRAMSAAKADSAPSIPAGESEIRVHVSLTFKLKAE